MIILEAVVVRLGTAGIREEMTVFIREGSDVVRPGKRPVVGLLVGMVVMGGEVEEERDRVESEKGEDDLEKL